MRWQPCAVCGCLSGVVSPDCAYPELCGECGQLLIYRPQDFERKVAQVISRRPGRDRAKAWFDAQAKSRDSARFTDMWTRLEAADLKRALAAL